MSPLEEGGERGPGCALGHWNLGLGFDDMGNPVEAAKEYSKALKIDPNFSDANGNLGNILLAQGKVDQAAWHYREELRINPTNIEALSNLGSALGTLGKLDEAVGEFRELCESTRSFWRRNTTWHLRRSRGADAGAIESYKKVLRINPNHYWAHNNLALLLAKECRMQEAISHFEAAVHLSPVHKPTARTCQCIKGELGVGNRE